MPLFQTGGKAQEGIPREAFCKFVDHNFGTQVLHSEHFMLHAVTSKNLPKSVLYKRHFIQGAYFQEIRGIQLLSMHKPASLEDQYFREGEFLFDELTGAFTHPIFESSLFDVHNKLVQVIARKPNRDTRYKEKHMRLASCTVSTLQTQFAGLLQLSGV